jgi:hypothetical protein
MVLPLDGVATATLRFSPGASQHPVFGRIVQGYDVVEAISRVPTRDENPVTPIQMLTIAVAGADVVGAPPGATAQPAAKPQKADTKEAADDGAPKLSKPEAEKFKKVSICALHPPRTPQNGLLTLRLSLRFAFIPPAVVFGYGHRWQWHT